MSWTPVRTVAAAVAGWFAGIAGSGIYLSYIHNGQPNLGGDWMAAVTAASVGTALMTPAIYLPLMRTLRGRAVGRRWWVYPTAGAAVCPLPWLVAGGWFGGPTVVLTLVSAEAAFVYSIFAPVGAVFGAMFWWLERRKESLTPRRRG